MNDVIVVFDINKLNETLIMTNTIYQENEHYKYFNCKNRQKFRENNN